MTHTVWPGNRHYAMIAGLTLTAFATAACSPGPAPDEQPNSAVGLWDPCTEIPHSVLAELGVDPATETGTSRETPRIRLCQWTSSPATWQQILEVTATTIAFDTTKQINAESGFTEITIHSRPAIRTRSVVTPEQGRCDIASASPWGTVTVSVTLNSTDDPCPAAEAAAARLDAVIPQ
ncbi:DUF3558 family protein [Nocardia sp. NPDC057227]|uniref:DUF3558 family protein n=1 Tax=Nocardia sp. NPDC057227 TaxID=3346056 RepID=UPI0036342754